MSNVRYARILFVGAQEVDDLDPLTIDLFLDEENRVAQKFPTSGWWGKIKSDDFLPFTVFPSGKLDYGTGFDESGRYATSTITEKRLVPGEYITMEDENGPKCFKVKQVLWLDELVAA